LSRRRKPEIPQRKHRPEEIVAKPRQIDGLVHRDGRRGDFREIPLSPVLLLGLDRQKRAGFLDLWRGTFSR
jgi:hypothetical protein